MFMLKWNKISRNSCKIYRKIGRYVRHAVIAESIILAYDGESVTFKYKRYKDNEELIKKVPVFEFIKKVIIHIPDKNIVRWIISGIYYTVWMLEMWNNRKYT